MVYASVDGGMPQGITPRVIIHGGAGNIRRDNLPLAAWKAYEHALLSILRSTHHYLCARPSKPPTALEAAVHAVSLLETCELFNAAIGAVFTRAGTTELEASVMVSRHSRKRGVGVSLLKHVRSPIKLAKELLERGEADDGDGAFGHTQLSGSEAERLAKSWGLEMCKESTFWTKKRWDEHKRGLAREHSGHGEQHSPVEYNSAVDSVVWREDEAGWDGKEYLPQGTVGAVVLDAYGTIAVATSTGGLTNKVPGRIGDTPTLGAGFWAEEWMERLQTSILDETISLGRQISVSALSLTQLQGIRSCFPAWLQDHDRNDEEDTRPPPYQPPKHRRRAVAMSGTGNGDSFLKLCAVRTTSALSRFSQTVAIPLQDAVSIMAGAGGELQRSAGLHWGKTGEGEGGIIGIELVGTTGQIVCDFNRAMFRAWIDEQGSEHCMVFRDHY